MKFAKRVCYSCCALIWAALVFASLLTRGRVRQVIHHQHATANPTYDPLGSEMFVSSGFEEIWDQHVQCFDKSTVSLTLAFDVGRNGLTNQHIALLHGFAVAVLLGAETIVEPRLWIGLKEISLQQLYDGAQISKALKQLNIAFLPEPPNNVETVDLELQNNMGGEPLRAICSRARNVLRRKSKPKGFLLHLGLAAGLLRVEESNLGLISFLDKHLEYNQGIQMATQNILNKLPTAFNGLHLSPETYKTLPKEVVPKLMEAGFGFDTTLFVASEDGMNCLLAASPFPPVTTSTTTTTTTTTTTSGGGRGDPHIYTLGGEHYLLLGQGSFSFWRFSGVDAEALCGNMWKKAPVDFQIYAHYSTHSSWTKGLLLVDQSGHQGYGSRALELTSEDCRWRSKVPGGTSWHMVDEAKLISDGDEMTAFKLVRSQSQRMHVELLMKTQTGWKNIGKLYATCKPGYHINMKMTMFSKEDVNRVQGQLGVVHHSEYRRGGGAGLLETDQSHQRTDQEFLLHKDWVALGGSTGASVYLKETDEDGPAVLKGCSESERAIAGELCVKFLGSEEAVPNFQESMEDCVFDVCAGGGEAAAELAADIMKAF